jgi:Protein of unknown function (DUF3352)
MPGLVKLRLVLPALLALLVALFAAGCGGGDGGGNGTDPASIAPSGAPLYIDLVVQPEGETKSNIETLARRIAGVDDLGGLIVEELESSAAEEGEEIDFEKDIQPWLGERAGLVYPNFDEGEFDDFWAGVQVTDTGAAEDFLAKDAGSDEEPAEKESYEGVDFWVEDDGDASGVVDDLLVVADSEALFKEAVDASNGETLAEEGAYTDAVAGIPGDSAADVYVDIGGLFREAEANGEVDEETKAVFENAGLELKEATAVASLVPGSDQIELDISSNVSGDNPPSGDASELLGSLPATSVAALASSEFGKRLNEGLEQIDEEGIPSEGVPPHQLKKSLEQMGIDLESIANSIGDLGLYVTGSSERSLGGALVLTTEDATQAQNTVSNLGLFIRSTGTPGVTKITKGASGFSIRNPELGPQPVVVAAKGNRIAIGYGLAPTLASFQESGKALADSPTYKEALSALGDTPATAFIDGAAALNLAEALVPPGEIEFEEAAQYLQKIAYIAIGSEVSGDRATAKLIVGIR